MKTPCRRAFEDVKAEIYADLADPARRISSASRSSISMHTTAEVKTASLRAGTRCCDQEPQPALPIAAGYPFQQAAPTFTEDIVIPWEGKRLLDAVRARARQDRRRPASQAGGARERRPRGAPQARRAVKDILRIAGADPAASRRRSALRVQAGL